ncbi:MAG: hypothetical protein DLM56_12360 [Pseudonocardiales bacterium]|nr:MAG: hypothetical protein DLM56_12360 [Pseudonocardiales bacterium]
MVAGTTGAGKSELLQTIIAGLAVANRPDAMTFVLIDYKGGAAFKDCNTLPHTVGMVTDLDGHLTERALASLNAELKRREHLLGTVAAKDIEDYWDTTDGTAAAVLPRLVLVIDEFASLVEELPDFVTGLVGIAMRGRSLGVHLILATQRPSGVVSPVIRANTNLRIALRVTDAAESTDVIDAPDSAAIGKATPGRAFARVGAEAPVEFQAARVGGRALVPEATTDVRHLPWPPMVGVAEDGAVSETTDLQVLARAIREAASDVAPIRSPWLPPLPAAVVVSEPAEPGAGAVPYAIADRPSLQDRADVAFALPAGESLLVAGSAGSGRSSALRTIIGAAARLLPPTDLHVFVLDCAGGSLVTADELPHCAGYCGRADVARGARMLDRLSEEVVRRQALLARSGFASVTEQHAHVAADERLPWLLLLVDGWEGFVAEYDVIDSGRPVDVFGRLVREGVSAGVRAIVSGDRAALTARATSSIATRLVLRFADRADYGLVGLRGSSLPATMPPGRGVIVETTTEVQVALLDPDPGGPAQTAALRRIAATARETHAGADPCRLPRPVQPLPDRIALEAVPTAGSSGPLWTVIGVGGDDAGVVGVDLAVDGPGLLIAGPPRSGRSSALRTIAASLVGAGTAVVLVVARRSSLRSLHDRPGVLAVLGPDDADALADLAAFGPVVVLVDDVEAMTDAPVGGPLVDLLRADDGERAVVAAGRADDLGMTFRGILPAVRASRAGVLLQPRAADGDLLGVRLPRTAPDPLPGRGLLVVAGTVTPVQVAVGEPPAMQRPAGRIGTAALRRGA